MKEEVGHGGGIWTAVAEFGIGDYLYLGPDAAHWVGCRCK